MANTPTQEELVVSLGTPIEEADANAVAAVMRAFITLINSASDSIAPEVRLSIRAKAFRSGSFEIPFEMIGVGGAFALAHFDKIREVLQALKLYFEIRVIMRGKPVAISDSKGPITIQHLTINGNDGTINLLINPHVTRDVSDAAAAIKDDATIEGVRVLQGPQRIPLIELNREQLEYLKQDDNSPTITPPFRERDLKRAHLTVRSPDLLGDSMWSFNHKNHKIDASIQDIDFMKAVRKGEKSFTAGTQLVGDMTIHEEYDAESSQYIPKRHTITKVHLLEHQKQLADASNASPSKNAQGKTKRKRKRKN